MPMRLLPVSQTAALLALLTFAGCGATESKPTSEWSLESRREAEQEAKASDPKLFDELNTKFNAIIKETTTHYKPIFYKTKDDLIDMIASVEGRLRNPDQKTDAAPARILPELEQKEEDEHLLASIARWTDATKADFWAGFEEAKAAKANGGRIVRKQKNFHIDDFVSFEVVEMRERANRTIHRRVRELLAPYKTEKAKIADYFEKLISGPPYQDPDAKPASKS